MQFLQKGQNKDGSFDSLSSPHKDFQFAKSYQTTFFSSLILPCLDSTDERQRKITERLTKFLVAQKSGNGSFNYWSRQSAEYNSIPYPDDLDDTFCALGALSKVRPDLIDGLVLAQISKLLITTEQKPGGPYRTWLIDASVGPKWQDLDLVVNSNIAWFLSQQNVDLPGINTFVETRIQSGNLSSPYYPNVLPVLFFISRWYKGAYKQKLIDLLLSSDMDKEYLGSLQNAALMVLTLSNFGVATKAMKPYAQYIEENYASGWLPDQFCVDPVHEGQQYFAGSPYLTAALCIQAMQQFAMSQTQTINCGTLSVVSGEQSIHESIVLAVEHHFVKVGPEIAMSGPSFMRGLIKKDTDHQITLLSSRFAQAMNAGLPTKFLQDLGKINLYGWIAYTIYDQIMDEAKLIKLAPVAQVCARQLGTCYLKVAGLNIDMQSLFNSVMNGIDEANAWELIHARADYDKIAINKSTLPKYDNLGHLARKSMGHSLGPLIVMFAAGYDKGSPEYRAVHNFFHHYLIARQLNDDAHDWEVDLARGQLTSVVAWLLQEYFAAGYSETNLDQLRTFFWRNTIHTVNKNLNVHINEARTTFIGLPIFTTNRFANFIERMLRPYEQAMKKAIDETEQAKSFLSEYKNGLNLV